MPANVVLKSVSLVRETFPEGYLVISGVIYDGVSGISNALTDFPPLHYRRQKTGPRDQKEWRHEFGGDGALLMSFDVPPRALGWVITIVRAEDEHTAGRLLSALGSGLSGLGELVKPLQIPGKVVETVGSSVESVPGAKVLGTHIGSEVDEADLQSSFDIELTNFKTRIHLGWR